MNGAKPGRIIFLLLSGGGKGHDANEAAQRATWAKDNPAWGEIYWLKADPNRESVSIDESSRIIWIPCEESSANLLLKTVAALQSLIESRSISYVIRSNTSNYFHLRGVFETVERLPSSGLYGGQIQSHRYIGRHSPWLRRIEYISGAGIWMSHDVAKLAAQIDTLEYRSLVDDVALGAHFVRRPMFEIRRVNLVDFEPLGPGHSLRVKSEVHPSETARRMRDVHEVFNSGNVDVLRRRLREFDRLENQMMRCEPSFSSCRIEELTAAHAGTFETRLEMFRRVLFPSANHELPMR